MQISMCGMGVACRDLSCTGRVLADATLYCPQHARICTECCMPCVTSAFAVLAFLASLGWVYSGQPCSKHGRQKGLGSTSDAGLPGLSMQLLCGAVAVVKHHLQKTAAKSRLDAVRIRWIRKKAMSLHLILITALQKARHTPFACSCVLTWPSHDPLGTWNPACGCLQLSC